MRGEVDRVSIDKPHLHRDGRTRVDKYQCLADPHLRRRSCLHAGTV